MITYTRLQQEIIGVVERGPEDGYQRSLVYLKHSKDVDYHDNQLIRTLVNYEDATHLLKHLLQ